MRPVFMVFGDEQNLTAAIRRNLITLTITDGQGFKSDRLEIKLADGDGVNEPFIEFPAKGTKMKIFAGYGETAACVDPRYINSLTDMGEFVVDETNYDINPDVLKITGHANDTGDKFKKSKTRSFHGKTVKQIVEQIGKEQGKKIKVDETIGAKKIPHIDQTNQSDMAFLTELGRRTNSVMKVVKGTILFGERGKLKKLAGDQKTKVEVDRTDCSAASFLVNSRSEHDGVKAKVHKQDEGKEKVYTEGEDDVTHTLDEIFPTEEQGKDAAKSKKEALDRSTETVSLTCVGDPALMAEAELTLTGFRPGIRTDWIIKQAVHTFDGSGGYSTQVDGELPKAASKEKVKGRAASKKDSSGAKDKSGGDAKTPSKGGAGTGGSGVGKGDFIDSQPDTA